MEAPVSISKAATSNWVTFLAGNFDDDGPAPTAAQFIGSAIDHGDVLNALRLTTENLRRDLAERYLEAVGPNMSAVVVNGHDAILRELTELKGRAWPYYEDELRLALRSRWRALEDGWAIGRVTDGPAGGLVTFVPRRAREFGAQANGSPVASLWLTREGGEWVVAGFYGGDYVRALMWGSKDGCGEI